MGFLHEKCVQLLLSYSKISNDTAFCNKLLLLARLLITCYGSISKEYTSLKLTISALWHLDQFTKVNRAYKSLKLSNYQSRVPVPAPHAGIIVGAVDYLCTAAEVVLQLQRGDNFSRLRIEQTVILKWNLWGGQVSSPSLVQLIQYQP